MVKQPYKEKDIPLFFVTDSMGKGEDKKIRKCDMERKEGQKMQFCEWRTSLMIQYEICSLLFFLLKKDFVKAENVKIIKGNSYYYKRRSLFLYKDSLRLTKEVLNAREGPEYDSGG